MGSKAKSQSGKSQVNGEWQVEKIQEKPKTEVEKFLLKEEGELDREKHGDELQ